MTTDIVERLREAIRDPECPVQFSPVLMAARTEIERLLGACKDKADLLKAAYAQIDHLREQFERLERAYMQLRETYLTSAAP